MSISTGYLEAPLDSTTWQVSFVANPETEIGVVNRYVLFRAAELTTQHGFDYFLILDYWNNSKTTSVGMEPGPSLVSCPTRSPAFPNGLPQIPQFVEGLRSAAVTVRMMHGQCPDHNPQAYEARSMIATMEPSIARGN